MKNLNLLSIILLPLIVATCTKNAIAQTSTSNENQRLVITGSPIQKRIEGDVEQLHEFDNEVFIDAGDLLTRIAGFSAIRAGGHGVDPVLRGQSQTRINILQQGAFLHGAGPNRMDSPGSFSEPFGWDEVQIIKGVETLILGSGGPAGTVNFKRYQPNITPNQLSGKLLAAYANEFKKIGADLAVGNDNGYLRLISQQIEHENYKDGNGSNTRTAFKNFSNSLVAGYTPSELKEWRFTIMANRGSEALFAGTMMDGPQTNMDALQLIFFDGDNQSNEYSEYQVYFNQAHHIMDNYSLRQQTANMRMLTDAHSKTKGLKWLRRWQGHSINSHWQASFDWQNVTRNAQRFMSMMGTPSQLQARVWPHNELDILGFAIETEQHLTADLRLKFGARLDHVNAQASYLKTVAGQVIFGNYYNNTPWQSTENNVSAFSRYYRQTKQALYWLGLSSTARTADATERYIAASNNNPMMRWIGNPAIKPERHNQLELGAKWKFEQGWQQVSLYHDRVSDFILRDRATSGDLPTIVANDMATVYRNVDATLTGFEYAIQKPFAKSWNVFANLAYVKGENTDEQYPLYQIPPLEGLIQLKNKKDQWAYSVDFKFAMQQNEVDDSMIRGSALDAGQSGSWVTIDLKLQYDFTSNWQLTAGIKNLFDKAYAYHVSRANSDPFNPDAVRVNEPGRQLWLSVLTYL